MMIAINIVLAVVAAVLLVGVIGERDVAKQKNITSAFALVVLLIIAVNIIK